MPNIDIAIARNLDILYLSLTFVVATLIEEQVNIDIRSINLDIC